MRSLWIGVLMVVLLAAVVFVLVLNASSGGSVAENDPRVDLQVSKGVVDVFHDDELNVTCWTFEARYAQGGGVSCIPDWQLEEPVE